MKPILFNTKMVRAILDGRKTVTRRIAKGKTLNMFIDVGFFDEVIKDVEINMSDEFKYKVGDVLYVRETFAVGRVDLDDNDKSFISQCIGENSQIPKEWAIRNDIGIDDVVWTPSIHMPKEAARIFLKVTDVRVERLQEITEEQAELEGILFEPVTCELGAKKLFEILWNSTIKKCDLDQYGWDANPWVWVIDFERCEKPESAVPNENY